MGNVKVAVQRDIEHSAARVWAILGDFGDMSWTEGAERVEVEGSGPGMVRKIHIPGLPAAIEEVLEAIDPVARTFSYTIPRGLPMPIADYRAQVRVEDLGGNRSRVYWSATGSATGGVSGEQASAIVDGAYAQLLGWLDARLAKG